MSSNNILAEEIMKRINRADLEYLDILKDENVTVDDLVDKTKNHRNTVSKVINGLYKACLISYIQKSEENNKKFYTITKFGLSILKNKGMR